MVSNQCHFLSCQDLGMIHRELRTLDGSAGRLTEFVSAQFRRNHYSLFVAVEHVFFTLYLTSFGTPIPKVQVLPGFSSQGLWNALIFYFEVSNEIS